MTNYCLGFTDTGRVSRSETVDMMAQVPAVKQALLG